MNGAFQYLAALGLSGRDIALLAAVPGLIFVLVLGAGWRLLLRPQLRHSEVGVPRRRFRDRFRIWSSGG